MADQDNGALTATLSRALAVQPRLIMCDEPVLVLDVLLPAQVVNLLERLGLAHLFVAP